MQHSLGDLPVARRLSRARKSLLRRGKDSNYISGQYLFGETRVRTYGGERCWAALSGDLFSVYLPAWWAWQWVGLLLGPRNRLLWDLVGELEPAGGMGGTCVSHRLLGLLRGWRMYHPFGAPARCREMCSHRRAGPCSHAACTGSAGSEPMQDRGHSPGRWEVGRWEVGG